MNKLVSRNPVQRFKEGKKIQKMQNGDRTYYEITERPKLITSKAKEEQTHNYYRKVHNGKWTWGQIDNNGNFIPINKQVVLDNGTILNLNGSKSFTNVRNIVNNPKLIERGYIDSKGTKYPIQDKKSTPTKRQSSTPRRPLKTKEQWDADFNNAKNQLTSQQLMYLDSLGIDTSSAEKMQQGINTYNKNNNINVKELVEDNKWGDKSKSALSTILSFMPTNYRNENIQQRLDNKRNIPQQLTPNFGYRTNNTYEDVNFRDRLKSMGIGSNADLIDFGWRTQGNNYDWKGNDWAKQFRSDINQALGGDWSDNNIRKTFNISGNWGRGFLGSGDMSDFQRTLQTNAGSWNGAYDKAKEQYESNKLKFPEYMKPITNWFTGYYKQGRQLPSRNPIQRFKSNFR